MFTLSWLQSPELRRRATAGLNKGEAKHTLKRAVFFNRLGEVRDCAKRTALRAIALMKTSFIGLVG
nr:Tn3 family transposase [Mastigocladopsis repens]